MVPFQGCFKILGLDVYTFVLFRFCQMDLFCCIVVFWTHFDVWLLVSSYLHWLACTMMRSWPWCPAWQLSSTSLAPSLGGRGQGGVAGVLDAPHEYCKTYIQSSSLFLASSVILSLIYNGSLRKGSKAPVMDLDHQMGHIPPPWQWWEKAVCLVELEKSVLE